MWEGFFSSIPVVFLPATGLTGSWLQVFSIPVITQGWPLYQITPPMKHCVLQAFLVPGLIKKFSEFLVIWFKISEELNFSQPFDVGEGW